VARERLDRGVVAEEVELPAALSVVLSQHARAGQRAVAGPQRLEHQRDGRVLLLGLGRVKLPRRCGAVLDGVDHAVGVAVGAFVPGVGAEAQYVLADPRQHHRGQPVPQGAADVVLRALEVPVEVDPDAELHHPLPPALASRTARMSRVSLLVGHDMSHG
jgi:hypothetical protein